MPKLYLYSFFHANLQFSSIPTFQYPAIIEKCYWPVLKMLDKYDIALGFEFPAYTLEKINAIDKKFLPELKKKVKEGKCEVIGSGYSQNIMPLIPAEVNMKNLNLGTAVYKKLLEFKPSVLYLNEQVYSKGLVKVIKKAGYSATVLDWDNSQEYGNYPSKYRYSPLLLKGTDDQKIKLLWNSSIAFQKFQRYIKNEIPLDDYIDYLNRQKSGTNDRAFPMYGSDWEIFNYSPGSSDIIYKPFDYQKDLKRLEDLFRKLQDDKNIEVVTPSAALKKIKPKEIIEASFPEYPVVVKKQAKYNVTRWAVCGRDNTKINTQCYAILKRLKSAGAKATKAMWNELCYLFGSDFRTFTTDEKFAELKNKLGYLDKVTAKFNKKFPAIIKGSKGSVKIEGETIITPSVRLELLSRRGGAIKKLIFPKISDKHLAGTIPHDYYDQISFSTDQYSGHTIIQEEASKKSTDLERTQLIFPEDILNMKEKVQVLCKVPLAGGDVWKKIYVYINEPRVDIEYNFRFRDLMPYYFRCGMLTLNPEAFDRETLRYSTVNGGYDIETFYVKGKSINEIQTVDSRVSSSHCLGATDGWVDISDDDKGIMILIDKAQMYSAQLLHYQETRSSYYFRIYNSLCETDDTTKQLWRGHSKFVVSYLGHKGSKPITHV
ncbi:MAG: hypothetical protein ABH860_06370 [bacterium]